MLPIIPVISVQGNRYNLGNVFGGTHPPGKHITVTLDKYCATKAHGVRERKEQHRYNTQLHVAMFTDELFFHLQSCQQSRFVSV